MSQLTRSGAGILNDYVTMRENLTNVDVYTYNTIVSLLLVLFHSETVQYENQLQICYYILYSYVVPQPVEKYILVVSNKLSISVTYLLVPMVK